MHQGSNIIIRAYGIRRIFACFLFLAVFVAGAAATDYIIDSYVFDVKGSSKPFMLRSLVVPDGEDPVYATLEDFVDALEEKRQTLFNKRVFEDVSYTYELVKEEAGALHYRVTFFVDDAFTFLAIPYPKYDSNYGFSVGLKLYEKNMFGLFGDFYGLVKATQIDSSWEDWEILSEFDIDTLPVGRSILNLDGSYIGTYQDEEFLPEEFSFAFDWDNLSMLGSHLDMAASVEAQVTYDAIESMEYAGDFSWEDISVLGSNFSLSGWIDGDMNDEIYTSEYEVNGAWVFGDSEGLTTSLITTYDHEHDLTARLRFSDTTVNDKKVVFEPILVQYIDEDTWQLSDVQLHLNYSPFKINDSWYAIDILNTLPIGSSVLETSTTICLLEETIFTFPLDVFFTYETALDLTEWNLYDNFYKTGFSSSMKLPLGITYEYSYSGEIWGQSEELLNAVPVARTSQSLSMKNVDWKNNFRRGMEFSASLDGGYAGDKGIDNSFDRYSFTAYGSMKTFVTLGTRLGFSSRITGMYAHLPEWALLEREEEDRHYPQFIPANLVSNTEQIRGILNDNIEAQIGDGEYRKVGAIANLDLTLMFIKFEGFAEGFISTFMDIGVFTPSETGVVNNTLDPDSIILLKSVGIEGYGILDKFRSYPIRMSLGVNYDDLAEHLSGSRNFSDIEYELTLGMGLHY